MKIISSSKYNAHSEPLFKVLDILKIEHLFSQSCLKFVYKFKKRQLPKYFLSFQCVPRSSIHDHDTRGAEQVDTIYTRTHMAANWIRSHLPVILNDTPAMIINKINTHSIQGFSFFTKRYYLSQYTTQCQLRGCFICNNWFFFIFPDVSKLLQIFLTVAGSRSCFLQMLCYCRQCHNQHYRPSSSYASCHHPNPHHEIKHLTYIVFVNEIYNMIVVSQSESSPSIFRTWSILRSLYRRQGWPMTAAIALMGSL